MLGHLRRQHSLRAVDGRPPSVDSLVRDLAETGLPHPVLVDLAREAIATAGSSPDPALVSEAVSRLAAQYGRRLLNPVVNATGVLLHTNLGRAPVALSPVGALLQPRIRPGRPGNEAAGPTTLPRCWPRPVAQRPRSWSTTAPPHVLLVLTALAAGREVIVSRGELVEIGGGSAFPR